MCCVWICIKFEKNKRLFKDRKDFNILSLRTKFIIFWINHQQSLCGKWFINSRSLLNWLDRMRYYTAVRWFSYGTFEQYKYFSLEKRIVHWLCYNGRKVSDAQKSLKCLCWSRKIQEGSCFTIRKKTLHNKSPQRYISRTFDVIY